MRAYLIRRSQEGTDRTAPWNEAIFDSIAWQQLHEVFRKLTIGQRTQLSKYMNDLLLTAKRLQLFDNRNDGRCFACGLLWEDTNHVLRCCCEARTQARTAAFQQFREHLQRQHTPDIFANLLCDSMTNWISRRRIAPPTWTAPFEPIHRLLTRAFHAQTKIGWDQFFRGRIALAWQKVIEVYYKERRPGSQFTPSQWLRTTIDAIWKFSLTLWRHRNKELHGDNGETSREARRKVALEQAKAVYTDTIGNVTPQAALLLHRHRLTTMTNWTKQHLDAYLATAQMACEWNVEPG
jgi:hypothetical protein